MKLPTHIRYRRHWTPGMLRRCGAAISVRTSAPVHSVDVAGLDRWPVWDAATLHIFSPILDQQPDLDALIRWMGDLWASGVRVGVVHVRRRWERSLSFKRAERAERRLRRVWGMP